MKKISILLLLFILNSCSTNYYSVNFDEDATIYNSKDGKESITVIPKGFSAYITKTDKKTKKVKWKNFKGWVINPVYSNPVIANNSSTYNASNSNNESSSSNYNSSSTKTSSGGSVQVKGYTRKNGTYVAPHTRSAPRRR